ncbi:hypothetical protein GCM10009619_41040 [Williamsia maris]
MSGECLDTFLTEPGRAEGDPVEHCVTETAPITKASATVTSFSEDLCRAIHLRFFSDLRIVTPDVHAGAR